MSVDDTLRAAFAEETVEAQTGAALRQVHARVHRRRVWRASALAGVAAVAAIVVGLAVSSGGPQAGPEPTSPGTGSSTPGYWDTHRGPSRIDGTWRLGPVSAAEIRATLREAGRARFAVRVIHDLPPAPLRYRMTVGEHLITLELTGADGKVVVYDKEHFVLSGHRAMLQPTDTTGDNTYRWSLAHGDLRLRFVSTSVTKDDMNPYGAFQRAQYAVGDWTRVGRR